ncbi:DUF983 domain-containing protein [Paracoccus sp. Z118]|uniref:DUF983 domain-containing protein n=1 Tax=Paracoccus sp. Z118 TaxID=2851017 RepID=UPI001C2BDD38|nr:DUF983 domain-containing protein [Paracoccus sp. Z118]MBV0891100.1 DUF983 domain-containing protein [Paracoccus sp. Z118]
MSQPARDLKSAVLRGLANRCPNCGEGRVFTGYLKVVDRCENCGERLGEFRSADGPAFFTITIVMLLLIPLIGFGWLLFRSDPLTLMLVLCGVTTIITLALLRLIKGIFVGFLWAHQERDRGAW